MYNEKSDVILANSIIRDNNPQEIIGSTIISYSNIRGGWEGIGNIDADPYFVDAFHEDYHLQSKGGRWNPDRQTWIIDRLTSLCIDAGDPTSDWMAEPSPNGGRINMGAYGGTSEASKSIQ